jgi:class 3 adenylate cyclase
MYCPECQHENRAGARFCESCGNKLEQTCPSCGNQTRPGAAFCDRCGTPLTEQASTPRPQTRDSRRGDGERRQLTVMFCDLVGSTALSEQLDPEELREVVQHYQAACEAVIHRLEGYIARYVGDALLIYFGYPRAHEDDAQRAVQAELEIAGAIHELPLLLQQPLQVRIGIHTGLVIVGELGGRDYREQMA